MAKGHKTGGRKKGTQNKLTLNVRDEILQVFHDIGGVKAMGEWAKENRTEYFKIFSKLIPKDVNISSAVRLEDLLGGGEDPDNDGGDS
jgi:hypothetical protein